MFETDRMKMSPSQFENMGLEHVREVEVGDTTHNKGGIQRI